MRWRAWLIYVHRWLGIAGGLLFLAWFASGIVMMYARMPAVTPDERLSHAAPLDLSTVRIAPADAVARAGIGGVVDSLQVRMLDGRPVYRLSAPSLKTVFADTGDVFGGADERTAMDAARRWAPEHASSMRYDGAIAVADHGRCRRVSTCRCTGSRWATRWTRGCTSPAARATSSWRRRGASASGPISGR